MFYQMNPILTDPVHWGTKNANVGPFVFIANCKSGYKETCTYIVNTKIFITKRPVTLYPLQFSREIIKKQFSEY